MGTSARRTALWLLVATLAIAVVALLTSGAGSAPGVSPLDRVGLSEGGQSESQAAAPLDAASGPATVELQSSAEEPLEPAKVTVKKAFEGPAWQFGFLFGCLTDEVPEFFPLGGDGSATFNVGFQTTPDATEAKIPCVVAEEPLLGDWTVTFAVDGFQP